MPPPPPVGSCEDRFFLMRLALLSQTHDSIKTLSVVLLLPADALFALPNFFSAGYLDLPVYLDPILPLLITPRSGEGESVCVPSGLYTQVLRHNPN